MNLSDFKIFYGFQNTILGRFDVIWSFIGAKISTVKTINYPSLFGKINVKCFSFFCKISYEFITNLKRRYMTKVFSSDQYVLQWVHGVFNFEPKLL